MTTATNVDTITVTINGETISVPQGTRIIQAAEKLGIEIPTFCYHPRMQPPAACRICTVEVVKPVNRMFMACSTELQDGMEVLTDSERTLADRRTNLDLLLTQHPLDCPVCDKGGECKLQDYSVKYGSSDNPFQTTRKDFPEDIRSNLLDFNSNRCILCGACIQVCSDIQMADAIGFSQRGFITVIGAPMGEALDCEFCGQCMDVCPVGAITSRFSKYAFRPWQEKPHQTTCTYCGCGCQYDLRSVDGEMSRVTPKEGVGPGEGSLCVKGHFGFHFMEDERRLTKPLVRRGDKLVETTWDEALKEAARGLAAAKAANGANAVAGIVGGRLCNEDIYLFARLIRGVIGSGHLDSTLRYGAINGATVMRDCAGTVGMMNSFDDIRAADCVLLVGSDITEEAPIAGLAVKDAITRGGKPVYTVDSMRTEIMRIGTGRLIIAPGSEHAAIKGLVKAVVDEGLIDPGVAERHPEAVAAIRENLSGTYHEIEVATGLTQDDVVAVARAFAEAAKGILIAGPRVTSGISGASAMAMLVDLAFLTGNMEGNGGGVNALTTENNELGLAIMGAASELLPGGYDWADSARREAVAQAWQSQLPDFSAPSLAGMFTAMADGRITAAYVAGTDPAGSLPESLGAAAALDNLDFLVVQELFLTETARRAHVVFPAQSYAEREGTFTNMEGRIQAVKKAMKAPGKARADWQILAAVAAGLGQPLSYKNVGEIQAEIATLVPGFKDLDTPGAVRLQTREDALTSYLTGPYLKGMATRYTLPEVAVSSGHETDLYLGESLYHSGSLSTYNWGLMKVDATNALILNPREARKAQISAGDRVRIHNARGSVEVAVKTDSRIQPGTAFFPKHCPDPHVRNLVQSSVADASEGGVIRYRRTQVTLEKVAAKAVVEA